MGLKLSEDGQNWIPIETESTNIPGEGVQTFPDDYEPSSALALLDAASLGFLVLLWLLLYGNWNGSN